MRAVVARAAARVHTAEAARGRRIDGAEPPRAGGAGRVVLVLHLAVAVLVVVVLFLVVLLRAVRVAARAVYLELRQQPDFVLRRRDVAGIVAAAAPVVAVLGAGHNHILPFRRECREERRADGLAHIAALPAAGVGVAGIHHEPGVGVVAVGAVVPGIHKSNVGAAGILPELEVDAVAALHAAVVVESEDKGVVGAIDRQRPHLTVYCDRHLVARAPKVRRLPGLGGLLDGGRVVVLEGRACHLHRHADGLVGRGRVVGALRALDRNGRRAAALGRDGDGRPAHTHGRYVRLVGAGRNHAVAAPGGRDRPGGGAPAQGEAALVQRQAARRFRNLPSHRFRPGRPIAELVVCFRGECGVVAACVGAGGRAAQRHFLAVVVAPCGGLRAPCVGQAAALRGGGDIRPPNRPVDRLGLGRVVLPLVPLFRRERHLIGARVGRALRAADCQRVRVVVVPARRLRLPVVGQRAALRGNCADFGRHFRDGLLRCFCQLMRGFYVVENDQEQRIKRITCTCRICI